MFLLQKELSLFIIKNTSILLLQRPNELILFTRPIEVEWLNYKNTFSLFNKYVRKLEN